MVLLESAKDGVPFVFARVIGQDNGHGYRPYAIGLTFEGLGYPVYAPGFEGPITVKDLAAVVAGTIGLQPEWLGQGFVKAIARRLDRLADVLRYDSLPVEQQRNVAEELHSVSIALSGCAEEFEP